MVVTNVWRSGVRPGDPDSGGFSEAAEAPGGGVAVHAGAAAVKQDRPSGPGTDGAVDSPSDGWRQRDQDDLAALATHAQDPVTVFLAQITDVRAGGLEDSHAQQPEYGHQREVEPPEKYSGY
jgi:hypothetical protein